MEKLGNLSGNKFIEFFEENTYSTTDIFGNQHLSIQPMYGSMFHGIAYTINVTIKMSRMSTIEDDSCISFNENLSYLMPIVDPNFLLMTLNSDLVPRSLVEIKPKAGTYFINLKVKNVRKLYIEYRCDYRIGPQNSQDFKKGDL